MTQRFWLPMDFYYTRLSQESMEVVLASKYDAVAQELEALKAQLAEMTAERDALQVKAEEVPLNRADDDQSP